MMKQRCRLLFYLMLIGCISNEPSFSYQFDEKKSRVCLSVGLYADIYDLDNITLTSQGVSGAAGTIYSGSDQFRVKSNGPVRIITSGKKLTHVKSNIALPTQFLLENNAAYLDTLDNASHDEIHTVSISAITTRISNSPAGQYEGEVTITVMPQYERSGGKFNCSTNSLIYPVLTEYATLAFEDLYPTPGDADYNDAVINFKVEEFYNSENQLSSINLEFMPAARGAGYDHALKLDLDGIISQTNNITAQTQETFLGDATINVTYENIDEGSSVTQMYEKSDDIVIFESTKDSLTGFANVYNNRNYTAPKLKTVVNIQLDSPELNTLASRENDGISLYRPYLYVKNTQQDIDLYSVNSNDGMVDANGYPFGMVVPYDWSWPTERSNINTAYPYFEAYRDWLSNKNDSVSEEALQWYLYPNYSYVYNQ